MNRLNHLKATLGSLKLNCEYWDVRIEDSFETAIDVADGEVVTCTSSPSLGAFLRVRKNGFWLYQSTTDLANIKSALTALDQQNPESGASFKFLSEKQPAFSRIAGTAGNVSLVPLESKLNLAVGYLSELKKCSQLISSRISYRDIYKVKTFLNSVGTEFEFDFNQAGMTLRYTLKEDQNIFDDKCLFYASQFEQLKHKELAIQKSIAESMKFLSAPAIEPGKYRVLLDPEVTGVFTHESFGHKSEADFMIGDPQALLDWKLGLEIASRKLSIVDCGLHENTSGYCPIDDDGYYAQKNYLIKSGVLTGRLHSVNTASQLNEKPTGNSRAMNFEFEPIVRMTSTYIEPGDESLESILQRSEGAILVEGVKHGSGLSTFTIAPHRGYMIGKNGERKPVRLAVISGSVFETLKNIDAVSSDFHLHSSAIGGCGKMDQWPLPVADGGPYILVKDMQVG